MVPILSIQNNFEYLQNFIFIIESLLKQNKIEEIKEIFIKLHPSPAALILQYLNTEERKKILEILDTDFNPEILSYLSEFILKEIISFFATNELASMLEKLNKTDATDIIENLTQEQLKLILPSFNAKYRKSIEQVLKYPENTAGRIMSYNSLTVPEDWNIGQIRNFIKTAKTLPRNLSNLYLINKKGQITGQIELKHIARLEKHLLVANYSTCIEITFSAYTTFDELIFAFQNYNLYIVPIVDEKNVLIGAIDISTILEIMQEKVEETLFSAAGINESDFYENIFSTSLNRFKWLFITVSASICTAVLNDCYIPKDGPSVYITVIMASCGAVGMQVTTVIANAIFSRELAAINITKTILKEINVAAINAVLFCIMTTGILYLSAYNAMQIIKFNFAFSISVICSALFGIIIPLIMKKFDQDPNSGSISILTSFTDGISIIMFILIVKFFKLFFK